MFKTDFDILNDDIKKQILGENNIFVVYKDYTDRFRRIQTETITIYDNDPEGIIYGIKIPFLAARRCSKEHAQKLLDLMQTNRENLDAIDNSLYNEMLNRNADGFIIVSGTDDDKKGYNSFMGKYYNCLIA